MTALKIGMPANYLESGINFIYFGDMHNQEKAPSGRTDDFHATETAKVKQILALGRKHKVRAFIQSGDFLDKPRISDTYLQKILNDWNFKDSIKAREDYENGQITKEEYADRTLEQIPIIGIVGNHEVFGGALKNFKRTSIKTMSDMGFINLVGRKKPYTFTMEGGKTVAISGQSYDLHLLKDAANFQLKTKFADVDIFMVHEALYDTSLNEAMNFMPISKVSKGTQADITIAGHIHNGFGWVESDGKIFGNPGVLAQQSSSAAELDRDVVVTLIHVSEEGEIFLEDIKLDTPRSRDIFDLTLKEEQVEREEQMARVREIIGQVDRIQETSATEIVTKVAATEGVAKSVLELAIKKTEDVIAESEERFSLDPNKDYRVARIILENFESHLYTEVELPETPLPTVFIGESSHGKSSILRAIYWCMENEGSGMDFIRRAKGVNRASVTIEQVDGTRVTRFIEKKTKRNGDAKVDKNGWEIVLPDGQTYETNTSGLPEIQKIFGLTYLVLDQKDSIGINFQKQEDPWFFIGLNSQQRAKVIGAMYGTQYILGGIKGLESQRRALEGQRKLVQGDIDDLSKQLEPLETAEVKSMLISRLGELYNELTIKDQKVETLKVLVNDYTSAALHQERVANFLEKAKSMDSVEEMIAQLKLLSAKSNDLSDFIKFSQTLDRDRVSLNQIKDLQPKLDEAVTDLSQLEALISREKSLAKYGQVYTRGLKLLDETIPVVESKPLMREVIKDLDQLKSLSSKRELVLQASRDLLALAKEKALQEQLAELSLDDVRSNLIKLKGCATKATAISSLVAELNELKANRKKGEDYLAQKRDELEQVQRDLNKRKTEVKHQHYVTLGPITIYGVKEVNVTEEEEVHVDEKIAQFTKRATELNKVIIQADTRLEEIKRRQAEAEEKIRAQGVEPDKAQEELNRISEEMKELEERIDTNLTNIEEVAEAMVAGK